MHICNFELSFRVDALPVAQPRPKVTTVGGHGRAYVSSKHPVHEFKHRVIDACNAAYDGDVMDLAFFLNVTCYFPRPANKIWKTKSMPNEYKITKPDLDNLAKPIKDALTGIIWTDDSRVADLRVTKLLCAGTRINGEYQSEKPGCDILIRGLTSVAF